MWLRQVLNVGIKSNIGRFNPNFKPVIPFSTPLLEVEEYRNKGTPTQMQMV